MSKGEKIKEAIAINEAKYKKQVIPICKGWSIRRFDEMNWVIPPTKERGGSKKEFWYYGSILHALEVIPHKMLNDKDKATLDDILNQLKEIKRHIKDLQFAKFDI